MEDLFEVLSSVTDTNNSSSPSSSSSIPEYLRGVEVCSTCSRLFNQSDHHLCALKCGHVFGLPCIERWAEEKLPSLCPLCNTEFEVTQVLKLFIPNMMTKFARILRMTYVI